MRKNILLVCILLGSIGLIGCKEKQAISKIEEKSEVKIEEKIEGKMILEELTLDEYEGRFVGSEGNKLAEDYLEEIFKKLDLKPESNNNYKQAYEQEVASRYGRVEGDCEIKTINNIVGKIEGDNNKCAIIVSAHFDHIGVQDNQIIKGAIDNASGVSILVNIANNLKNETLNYDVIFCAFNGEETGLAGSENFVKHIKDRYKNIININIDSVGYKNSKHIGFLNQSNTKLENQMKKFLEENDLVVGKIDLRGISDGKSFGAHQIENITLIDEGVKEIIHSEKDTVDKVDYKKLEKISDSVTEFIKSYSFKKSN